MKIQNLLKLHGMLLLFFIVILPNVNAQSRYKHVPRVKVDRNINVTESKGNVKENVLVAAPLNLTYTNIADSSVVMINDLTAVASITNDVTITTHKANKSKMPMHIETVKRKVNKQFFTEKVKTDSILLHVKDVKKTALLGYLIWFIVVLILVIALFVLAFVFLYMVAFTLFYLFLAFGIAAAVILVLILILGLTGIL